MNDFRAKKGVGVQTNFPPATLPHTCCQFHTVSIRADPLTRDFRPQENRSGCLL
jgi:hypothetical protein